MNKDIFLFLNSFAGQNHLLDMIFISFAKGMPYLFILIEVYLYFFAKRKNEAIYAFFSVIVALILNQIISLLYFHNRPFMDGIGTLLIKHSPDSSFPSDHTAFLFAIAFSLFFSKIKYSSLLLIIAFIGGLARVFVGVHYPFDIIGGVFTGFLGAGVIYIFRERLKRINEIIIKFTTF